MQRKILIAVLLKWEKRKIRAAAKIESSLRKEP